MVDVTFEVKTYILFNVERFKPLGILNCVCNKMVAMYGHEV